MAKVPISAVIEPETLRRVDADRSMRKTEDGQAMSRSAVVQEALELWLEFEADQDRERATRVSDRIEATQNQIAQSTDRLAALISDTRLNVAMCYQVLQSQNPDRYPREAVRGTAAKILRDEGRRR